MTATRLCTVIGILLGAGQSSSRCCRGRITESSSPHLARSHNEAFRQGSRTQGTSTERMSSSRRDRRRTLGTPSDLVAEVIRQKVDVLLVGSSPAPSPPRGRPRPSDRASGHHRSGRSGHRGSPPGPAATSPHHLRDRWIGLRKVGRVKEVALTSRMSRCPESGESDQRAVSAGNAGRCADLECEADVHDAGIPRSSIRRLRRSARVVPGPHCDE
jgi:hypothetical protein